MAHRKVLIATDAWYPQINGVVRTLSNTKRILEDREISHSFITPQDFATIPCPLYSEIRLAVGHRKKVRRAIERFAPTSIHIATEGPIGLSTRAWCVQHGVAFTTSFHTHFAKYLRHLAMIPESLSWRFLRWFHGPASAIMVATQSVTNELHDQGLHQIKRWSRGVDHSLFRMPEDRSCEWPRPVLMYVGRVSKEKNIEDFLALDVEGSKVVVGDGPFRNALERKYPEAHFVGYHVGESLARMFGLADVFVFPSRTETFGNVILESLACGTPVAAYPAPGPKDIICNPSLGSVRDDLSGAVRAALHYGERNSCAEYARSFSWEGCTDQFLDNLVPLSASRDSVQTQQFDRELWMQ